MTQALEQGGDLLNNIINYKDLDSISEQLDGMLVKHVDWLSALHKVIICNTSSNSLMMRHEECEFGKWYCAVENSFLRENAEFEELGNTHKNLHSIANQLLEKHHNNQAPSEEEYQLLVDSEKEFFETLNNYIDNVLATKNQFDYLTNIPNRSLTMLMLEKEHSKLSRDIDSESCIAFADIDHFKGVNDSYGHSAGDSVLKHMSEILSTNIRPYDIVGRYGGEEFLFCFPQTGIEEAFRVIDRIRCNIESSSILINNSNKIRITCSFGVAKMDRNQTLEESIKRADMALYKAKDNGRNKTEIWVS